MSPQPTPDSPLTDRLAGEPLDDIDADVLSQIAALYDAIDPVPSDLVERMQFAITLDALNAELAELQAMPVLSSARAADTSDVKTLTFTSDSLTTMISISASGPERVRIDGWAAPGGGFTVELRQVAATLTTAADEDGRFVFDDVPHGLTRFVVIDSTSDTRPPVITPAVEV